MLKDNCFKIIHIVDDDKFIDSAYSLFEQIAPNSNECISFSSKKKFKHIKRAPVKIYPPWVLFFYRFFPKLMPCSDALVLHGLDRNKKRYLKCLSAHKKARPKTCWIGWGFDYYCFLDKDFLKSRTREVFNLKKENRFVRKFKDLINYIRFGNLDISILLREIDLFAPVLYEDYVLMDKSSGEFGADYVDWNCGTLEDDLLVDFMGCKINGSNILLGNSATYTNNHLDAFELLNKIDLGERSIVTPLSYGDKNYREVVVRAGMDQFGRNFIPIEDFLPLNDYLKLLSSCSIVVMNHLRQQALGNIVIMLFMGAKVFLDSENPIYNFFKRKNAYVFCLNDLIYEIDRPLTEKEVEYNRLVVNNFLGKDVMLKKTEVFIDKLIFD